MINPEGVYLTKRFYVEFALKFSGIYFYRVLTREEAEVFATGLSDFCCHSIDALFVKLSDYFFLVDAKSRGWIYDEPDKGGE